MSHQDTALPVSQTAVAGVWINNSPVPFGDGYIMKLLMCLTLKATGEAEFHSESILERDGRPSHAKPTILSHAGTWTLETDTLALHLPTGKVPRDELTFVERRASDGLTRVVLRTRSGGVFWRPEAT